VVNSALVNLYFQLGAIISRRIAAAEWGDGVMTQLAAHIARTQRVLRGLTRANPFRMRQCYEAYAHDQKVSALPRQLPWTHNLIILSQNKWPEEREFYLRMAIQERWSSRTL
jgi:predicted nuclease of restriction endonuclease-like (RecB) superfamily